MSFSSRILLAAVALSLASSASFADRPLSKTKFDPSAEKVEMFAAMEAEQIEVTVIPKDEFGGNLFIKNNQKEPLNVQIPEGFVGVPVLAQFGGMGGTGTGGGVGGNNNGGGGQNQAFGGGGGGQFGGGGGGGQFGGGGGGFFSIPAEKTLRVPYTSVCLEHGKASPHPRTPYRVVPVEEYSDDPILQTVVRMVATGRLNRESAQAAAWHVANGKSWQELASMKYDRVGQPDTPFFSMQQLQAASQIVATAEHVAKEGAAEQPVLDDPQPVRRVR